MGKKPKMPKGAMKRGGKRVSAGRGALFTVTIVDEKKLRANSTSTGGHHAVDMSKYNRSTQSLLSRKISYAKGAHKRNFIRDFVNGFFTDTRLSSGKHAPTRSSQNGFSGKFVFNGKEYKTDNAIKSVPRVKKSDVERKFIFGTRGYKEAMARYEEYRAYDKHRKGMAPMTRSPKRTDLELLEVRRIAGRMAEGQYRSLSKVELDKIGLKQLDAYIARSAINGVRVERHTKKVDDTIRFSKAFERRYGKKRLYSNGDVHRDDDGAINVRKYAQIIAEHNKAHLKAQRDYRARLREKHPASPKTMSHIFGKWAPKFIKGFQPADWAKRSLVANTFAGYKNQFSSWVKPKIPDGIQSKLRKIRQQIIHNAEIATVEAQAQLMRELEYVKDWHNLTGNAYTGIMSAAYVTTDRLTVRKIYEQMPGVKGRRATRGKISAGKYKRFYRKSGGHRENLKDTGAHVYISRLFDRPSHYVFINADKSNFVSTSGGYAYKEALSILNQFDPRMTFNESTGETRKQKGLVATLKVVSGSPEYIDTLQTNGGNPIMLIALQRAEEILQQKLKHLM